MARIKKKPEKIVAKLEKATPAKGKRGRHWRTKWKREIFRQQRNTDLTTVSKAPMQRLIREIAEKETEVNGLRWNSDALTMVHVEAESFITELYDQANKNCIHAGRCTMRPIDLQLALSNYNDGLKRIQSMARAS